MKNLELFSGYSLVLINILFSVGTFNPPPLVKLGQFYIEMSLEVATKILVQILSSISKTILNNLDFENKIWILTLWNPVSSNCSNN